MRPMQVEETKRIIGLLPVALSTVMFNCVYAQMSTMFVEQV